MGKKHKPKIEASRDYRGLAAKNLQAFENEKNITPSEAADIVGISYKRYITIRKDGTGLDAEKLGRLHDLGGVRIDKLLTDESGKKLLRNPEYESDHDGWRLIEKTTSVIEQCSSSKERFKMYMALLEKSMKGIKGENAESND